VSCAVRAMLRYGTSAQRSSDGGQEAGRSARDRGSGAFVAEFGWYRVANVLGGWKRDRRSTTLVDSAPAGSQAFASFFSGSVSLADSGKVITRATTQKPARLRGVQLGRLACR
jgi:hypothetical protein